MKRHEDFKQLTEAKQKLYDEITIVQNEIQSEIARLKGIKSKSFVNCQHLCLEPKCHEYDPKIDYYDLYWKTFLLNQVKKQALEELISECESLTKSIIWLGKKVEKYKSFLGYRRRKYKNEFTEQGMVQGGIDDCMEQQNEEDDDKQKI